MRLQMNERQVGSVTILDLAGKLTIDDTLWLRDKINSLVQQQRTNIVLNLAQVSYIDSGGLGQLVSSFASVARTGGAMKLLNVNQRNHDLLSITRLVTVFQTFGSEQEAVESYAVPVPAGVRSITE